MFNLLVSPSDLYEPLGISEIALSEGGAEFSMGFSNKYPGNHTVGILIADPAPVGENYDVNFSVKIQISESDVVKTSKVVSDSDFPFWGGKNSSGIAFIHYRVPDDLSLASKLKLTVTVEKPSPSFEGKYGDARLFVKKVSDE